MPAAALRVRVSPRASRNQIVRYEAGVLHARTAAPPVDGAANRALIAMLAEALGRPKSAITIVAGASAREKRIEIDGLDEATLAARLASLGGATGGA